MPPMRRGARGHSSAEEVDALTLVPCRVWLEPAGETCALYLQNACPVKVLVVHQPDEALLTTVLLAGLSVR